MIEAPLERLAEDVTRMQALMTEAGRAVTGGFPVRTDAAVVRWPGRYIDERGRALWDPPPAERSKECGMTLEARNRRTGATPTIAPMRHHLRMDATPGPLIYVLSYVSS
jgi:hypothetical protein